MVATYRLRTIDSRAKTFDISTLPRYTVLAGLGGQSQRALGLPFLVGTEKN